MFFFTCMPLQWSLLLGSSLLLIQVIERSRQHSRQQPWRGHLLVGETNDASMPKVGRMVVSLTHAAKYVERGDHWIAFTLLLAL